MMNVPGILNGNPEACSKVAAALNLDKPVDGHAPLCTGADLEAYARAGIRTDHECTTSCGAQGTHLAWHVRLDQGRLAREKPSALDREPHCRPLAALQLLHRRQARSPTRSSAVTSTACWRWPSRRASIPLTP
ncbi:MAG: hypothetical protein ACLUNV_03930 [Sutterella wadsworthensis]